METQCDILFVAHLCNRQVHPCCHLNCSTLASQTGHLLEDETVTVWYAAFINDELIWDELAGDFAPSGSETSPRIVEQERQRTAGRKQWCVSVPVHFQNYLFPTLGNIISGRGGILPLELHGYTNVHSQDMLIIGGNYCILELTGTWETMREGQSVWPESQFSLLFVIFSNKNVLDPLLFLSAFISSAEKCLWGVILIELGNWILLHNSVATSFRDSFPLTNVFCPFNVSEKSCSRAMTIFFLSVPLFFVCLLFIALSWEKSCEISCQLGVNFLCSVIAAVLKPCVYSFYIPCILLFPKVIFNLDWTWI